MIGDMEIHSKCPLRPFTGTFSKRIIPCSKNIIMNLDYIYYNIQDNMPHVKLEAAPQTKQTI